MPKETAESFMLSHACIELDIVFRTTDTLFVDTCKIAINKNNRSYVRSKKGEKK